MGQQHENVNQNTKIHVNQNNVQASIGHRLNQNSTVSNQIPSTQAQSGCKIIVKVFDCYIYLLGVIS